MMRELKAFEVVAIVDELDYLLINTGTSNLTVRTAEAKYEQHLRPVLHQLLGELTQAEGVLRVNETKG